MTPLPAFADFFKALWGSDKDPFPWQTMLADHVADGRWPHAIDLPTASGKTACLDIAVYGLAAQADKPLGGRTAARRTWFVVDRRIVVDEAFDRATKLAEKLEHDPAPAIRAVAERLLFLRGLPSRDRPLAVGRLRGGVLRDDRWARVPSQAAIITSTVDQLGSRLLFRGYGHSALAAPIYAGLAGNDSLILLDEAHCAVPFLQTLRAVQTYRSPAWSELPNPSPFHVAILSATPPETEDVADTWLFPAAEERDQALNHPTLQMRLCASKPASLVKVRDEEALAGHIARHAAAFARNGKCRVGVIVNRVGRAAQAAALLRQEARKGRSEAEPPAFDVELLTGRIRPLERDTLVRDRLAPALHSSVTAAPARPLILVATQCLEVGADFSFDALVSECASLDALRQRFGRLDRLGRLQSSPACILTADSLLKEEDPIYGAALANTWEYLWKISTVEEVGKKHEKRTVDFGVHALAPLLPEGDDLRCLLAPAPDAPVLLPTHLDLLCQTAPMPHPDPDLGVFLHGKGRSLAEVRVVWRCDLDPQRPGQWAEIVGLCRPVTGEMLAVPLYRLRQWFRDRHSPDASGDVEGSALDETNAATIRGGPALPFLIWRGRDRSEVLRDPNQIAPGSIVVMPTPTERADADALGQVLGSEGLGPHHLDLWELAWQRTGRPAALRLHRDGLANWLGACPPLKALLDLVEKGDWAAAELRDALVAVRDWLPEGAEQVPLPPWLRELFAAVADFRVRDLADHPGSGLILHARAAATKQNEPDLFADDDDQTSEAPDRLTLDVHAADVERAATLLATACLGEEAAPGFAAAGRWHDAGKLDPRFQALLKADLAEPQDLPLAKSPDLPRSGERARSIREASGLPDGFRHEMFSIQLAQLLATAGLAEDDRDLFLHLIASHHGHARPFAPVCEDPEPRAVECHLRGAAIRLGVEDRKALPPPHQLDSGLADRFWALTRRFGWWGLAYREAILRLADWHASAHPASTKANPEPRP